MKHIIARKSDTSSKSENGILEHQHQHSRCGAQSGKQRHRILAQQDGNHHNTRSKEHQYSENTTKGMEILLCRRATFIGILQSLERTDEHQHRANRHHHDIDTRGTFQYHLKDRILQIHQWHQLPYHHSGHDMTSRGEHLLIEENIIPGYLRFLGYL